MGGSEFGETRLHNTLTLSFLQIKMLRTCDDRADKEVVVARELEVELKMLQKENESKDYIQSLQDQCCFQSCLLKNTCLSPNYQLLTL